MAPKGTAHKQKTRKQRQANMRRGSIISGTVFESEMNDAKSARSISTSPSRGRRRDSGTYISPEHNTRTQNSSVISHVEPGIEEILAPPYEHGFGLCAPGCMESVTLIPRTKAFPRGGNTMRVKVCAASFNLKDQKRRNLNQMDDSNSAIVLGNEVAGLLIDDNSTDMDHPGIQHHHKRVFGQSASSLNCGALQSYTFLNPDFMNYIPECITMDQAASLPSIAFAAYYYLFHPSTLAIRPPDGTPQDDYQDYYRQQHIVIIGGDSDIGRLAIQFAFLFGFGRIVVIGPPSALDNVKIYETVALIDDRQTEGVIQRTVQSSIPDLPHKVLDTINSDVTLAASLLNTRKSGTVMGVFAKSINNEKVARPTSAPRCKILHGHYIDSSKTGAFGRDFWADLPIWLKTGKIKPPRYTVMEGGLNTTGVNDVIDGYGKRETNCLKKYVVRPWDKNSAIPALNA